MKNDYKLFGIAFVLNLLENIILLFYYGVPITKQTIIGASIFGLCVVLLSKYLIEEK